MGEGIQILSSSYKYVLNSKRDNPLTYIELDALLAPKYVCTFSYTVNPKKRPRVKMRVLLEFGYFLHIGF